MRKPTIAYQLVAHGLNGTLENRWDRIYSKKIFQIHEEAQGYISDFRQIVTTPIDKYDLSYLKNDEFLKIRILEVEIF